MRSKSQYFNCFDLRPCPCPNMSECNNIYGYNTIDLIVNNEMKIDENDKDFISMLISLEQSSSSDDETMMCSTRVKLENKKNISPKRAGGNGNQSNVETSMSMSHGYHGCLQISNGSQRACTTKKGKIQEIFPVTLFKILEGSDAGGYSHIISWLPHGHAFKIHDDKMFEKYVLKKHFKSTFESFKRQLYIYGFKKIGRRFTDPGAYYHDEFIKGQQDLCSNIIKWTKKTSQFTTPSPNFDRVPTTLRNLKY